MALIYVVEDDTSILEIEEIALKNAGYEVIGMEKAQDFYNRLETVLPDLVLLDIMLPDANGFDIVKKIREKAETRRLPVIMVTAKTTELDMIKGLENGADDYIKKPFSVMELITRVKALLRRCKDNDEEQLELGGIVIDHSRRMVFVDGKPIELTYKEYGLLRYLAQNRRTVVSREKIMQTVWETDFGGESRTVDMHIKTLRKKLGEYGSRITTIRHVGYMFE